MTTISTPRLAVHTPIHGLIVVPTCCRSRRRASASTTSTARLGSLLSEVDPALRLGLRLSRAKRRCGVLTWPAADLARGLGRALSERAALPRGIVSHLSAVISG